MQKMEKIPLLTKQQITQFTKNIWFTIIHTICYKRKLIMDHFIICTVEKNGSIHFDISFNSQLIKKVIHIVEVLNDIIKDINIYCKTFIKIL